MAMLRQAADSVLKRLITDAKLPSRAQIWRMMMSSYSVRVFLTTDWISWQGVCGADRYTSGSVKDAARRIIQREGPGALLKGMRPRVLFHTPAAAICWSTYEAGKTFLQKWNDDQRP